MASVNEKELTRIIKSGELSGVYYLYGTDLYSVERYKREMVKRTVKAGDETYNLHEFEARTLIPTDSARLLTASPCLRTSFASPSATLTLRKRQSSARVTESLMKHA